MLFHHEPKHPTVGTGLSKLPWRGVFCLNQGFTLAQARVFFHQVKAPIRRAENSEGKEIPVLTQTQSIVIYGI